MAISNHWPNNKKGKRFFDKEFKDEIIHAFWAIRDLNRRDNPEGIFTE